MPVELTVAFSASELSTLDTLEAHCTLRNTGSAALTLPGENDRTSALTFNVYDRATGTLVRRMNGFSHQALMLRSRIDPQHELEVLPAGGTLAFTLDLAQFHLPLPAGEFEIEAVYDYPAEDLHARSGRTAVSVSSLRVVRADLVRDNPVLDGLALVLEDEDRSAWLRLLNHDRPLAAWYNRALALPPGASRVFCASAGFFQTELFDPFFEAVVLFEHGGHVVARSLLWGKPTGAQRAAPLPGRGRLCRSAFRTRAGEVFVFFQSDGLLEGYRLDASALVKVFERALPRGVAEVEVRADEDFVHLVIPHRGIVHAKIGIAGKPDSEERIHTTGLTPVSWRYEPAARRLKAVFTDGPLGRVADLLISDSSGTAVQRQHLAPRGQILEIAFDRGQRGEVQVLFSTSRRMLYFQAGERGPALIASGEKRFFPYVVAGEPAHLGYYSAEFGYRFWAYTRRRHIHRVVDYETAAWEQV